MNATREGLRNLLRRLTERVKEVRADKQKYESSRDDLADLLVEFVETWRQSGRSLSLLAVKLGVSRSMLHRVYRRMDRSVPICETLIEKAEDWIG